jgi:hypothetical protein
MGNAAQQFQQAREMNPLQLQQKQMELEQAEKVNPLLLRQQKQAANQSEIATEKNAMELAAKKAKAIHDSQISLINNPIVLQAEKDPASLKDADKEKLYKLIESSGLNQAKALGMDEARARELMQPTLDIAKSEPGGLRQLFKQRHIESLDAASRTSALSPSGVAINTGQAGYNVNTNPFGGTEGEIIRGTAYTQKLGPATTETITKDATGNDVIVVRDANGTITGVKAIPTRPPANAPAPRGGNAQTAPSAPVTPVNPEMPQMRYQRRDMNQPQMNIPPDERVAFDDGVKTVKSLRDGAAELTTAKNNLKNVIKTATGLQEDAFITTGPIASWIRNLKTTAGDETYKLLSKELANVQIANIKAEGGSMDTASGQNLQKLASGDETYPPNVIIKIANESLAKALDTEMRADAADKFVRKFGEANIGSFKDLWRKNSDTKAFQLLNLNKESEGLDKNSAEYKKIKLQTDALLGPNPTKRQELIKKITNLQKLSQNGEL